jgi:hypothetical protein
LVIGGFVTPKTCPELSAIGITVAISTVGGTDIADELFGGCLPVRSRLLGCRCRRLLRG